MTAVFKKEFKSYFCNPIGYIILALYFIVSGSNFVYYYSAGYSDASFALVSSYFLLLIIPALLTMRMISEDRRQKIDLALCTAPVSLSRIVMGKFLAALAVFGICNLLYVVYEIIISTYVAVNWLAFFNTLAAFIFMGAALIAIGLFISSLTESSIVAFILTFSASLVALMLDSIAEILNQEWLAAAAEHISFISRFTDAASSVFNISDYIYIGSFIALFLFLTISSLEKKRWS